MSSNSKSGKHVYQKSSFFVSPHIVPESFMIMSSINVLVQLFLMVGGFGGRSYVCHQEIFSGNLQLQKRQHKLQKDQIHGWGWIRLLEWRNQHLLDQMDFKTKVCSGFVGSLVLMLCSYRSRPNRLKVIKSSSQVNSSGLCASKNHSCEAPSITTLFGKFPPHEVYIFKQ